MALQGKIYTHRRGAFSVARFDNPGNAKAFTAWNGHQTGSTFFVCMYESFLTGFVNLGPIDGKSFFDSIHIMKMRFFLFVATMLASASLFAQSNNNVDEVVKIDRHAALNYREGEMIVKFKPTSAVKVRTLKRGVTSGMNTVDKVLGELGITTGEALMPLTGSKVVPGARALRSVSGKTIYDSDMSYLYRLTFDKNKVNVHEAIEKISALDEVEFAEPNYVVYSLSSGEVAAGDDPLKGQQWGHGQLKLDFLQKQKTITDKRPVIAILDTGIDIDHPDLKDNIWTNAAEANGAEEEDDDANGFADDLHGWDFVNQTGRIGDWNGHGTHCAGIAAAVGGNKIGITGANPDAFIMPVTVMQSDGTGDVATIIKGIDYAAANGADVISMSIGGYGYSLAEEQALAKAYSTAVLVAAAGNDGKCIYAHSCPVNKRMDNGPMFPAAFTFVLGVEASTKDGGLASFSNFDEDGPVFSLYNENQLYNYELRAPGAQITSTFPGGKYKALSGTSMACPYVAGGISRLLQVKEYGNWEILFGDLIHARMKHANQLVDFEAVYKITDADRKPSLGLVTYILDDAEGGDGDGRPDAGETIAFYPTLRNEWGQAKNIRFSLELAETEDPTVVEILDTDVDFGKELSSYGKNKSANPVRFKVNTNCVDGRHICMVLRATCDNIAEEFEQEIILTAENGVEIGGIIQEDMTLYPDVHYIVTKKLAIPKGVTLTIKPGTVLRFKGNTGFVNQGNLICEGTPGKLIVFTNAEHNIDPHGTFQFSKTTIKYVRFEHLMATIENYDVTFENCIFAYNNSGDLIKGSSKFLNSNFFYNHVNINLWFGDIENFYSNIMGNFSDVRLESTIPSFRGIIRTRSTQEKSILNSKVNIHSNFDSAKNINNIGIDHDAIFVYNNPVAYLGSTNPEIVQWGIFDINHPLYPQGNSVVILDNLKSSPYEEAHGIVWKVVVNGYDAQDEFEQMPPLGVGKHKFEVYFNRPMNKDVAPMIAMGVRLPYTSHTIAEDGSWNEEGTIYTAYLTITGKTDADGLNRIYVSGAEDDEYFEIPIEDTRFNVEVAAAGSMATGLMAEAGLGKVSLTWETDEEDFADLLGYNIYRYTMNDAGVSSDSIIINPTVIESAETSFVDYDVVPGTTYYYVIKQLTTSLTSHALSNAVAATPLTAQKGDANGSMNVDIADVVTEVAYITYQDPQPFIFEAADVNSDLKVNVLDVVGTLGIITNPSQAGVNAVDNEPVRYYVKNGVLYVETTQALGGVQVRLHVEKSTDIIVQDGVKGMEQTSVWTSDNEYLFLAYSMSGSTIAPGTHALLKIGDEALVTEMVISDAKGRNVPAVSDDATGIGAVKQVHLQVPAPNPFTTQLNVPYIIGMSGNHKVTLTFTNLAGLLIDTYNTVSAQGEHTYTWQPGALQRGLYFVTLYVDGKLVQTAKVVCNN